MQLQWMQQCPLAWDLCTAIVSILLEDPAILWMRRVKLRPLQPRLVIGQSMAKLQVSVGSQSMDRMANAVHWFSFGHGSGNGRHLNAT